MGGRTGIDRHTHQASPLDGALQNDIFRPIGHQHDDAVAGCDSPGQAARKAIRRGVEFREGPVLFTVAKRDLARMGARGLRHERAGDCADQTRFRHAWSR
ncbi:hypothetical protein GALL_473030 [mine drainage metagenome]|uniref:Uncharacterized protein n=1 Tax=mine drainage metagenome TaxID=410659 RepID=A0A1J5PIR4_9ZZZZ